MRLSIRNVGRFHSVSSIDIDGITVLAGLNGTGKSTIGKMLYCIFNSLYDYKNQIIDEKERSLYRILRLIEHRRVGNVGIDDRINNLLELSQSELTDKRLRSELATIIGREESEIEADIIDRVKNILTVSDENVLNSILNKRFVAEFDAQVGHVNYPDEESDISISIKDKRICIKIDNEGIVSINEKIEIIKDLVYIDDPYVVDDMSYRFTMNMYSHKEDLTRKLLDRENSRLSAVDDLIVTESLKPLYEKIDHICLGQIEQKENEFGYMDKRLNKRISFKNMSTGMKSFAILKSLLTKGYLEENGIVVLDEPEVHLHPEWMILYAEIVTLLQKELNINFVISTHSSEFLSYLELYIKKYELIDRSKFYLLEEDEADDSITRIIDYTCNLDKIYNVLTRPFIWASRELDTVK